MLIWLDGYRKIIAFNDVISKQEAMTYVIGYDVLWIESLIIQKPPVNENQEVEMYLNEDDTIRYEIVDLPKPPPTLSDVNKEVSQVKFITTTTDSTVTLSADDLLTLMEVQLESQIMLQKILAHLGI